ncbi:phosphoribosylanthranilate isomerase [Anaerovibrio sp. RM50]|uniref:phosphoribosylanthranilate isomerase n=1 Tax=Anaerovibrio sp. RM50 TaxID=1200557 RepID=UPI0005626A58|nr:phosphoribosylanthranilate isomerase [Anaerovibrio sp. RM50]
MARVKICGIRDMEAARAASTADFMGFIMSDRFRRFCPPSIVKDICSMVHGVKKVGVFVDQPLDEVIKLAEYCGLDMVQLHGHESIKYAEKIQKPIIKAFRYGEDFSVEGAEAYPAEFILIDSYSKNTVGGSGIAFKWREAASTIKRLKKPYIIAGGISADTLQEAITIFDPYGIDASGAMEIDGRKSPELIRKFLSAAGKKVVEA